MNAFSDLISRNLGVIRRALVRLPAEVAIAVSLAAWFSIALTSGATAGWENFARGAMTALLAYPLVFMASCSRSHVSVER